jgi:hypothetical protein
MLGDTGSTWPGRSSESAAELSDAGRLIARGRHRHHDLRRFRQFPASSKISAPSLYRPGEFIDPAQPGNTRLFRHWWRALRSERIASASIGQLLVSVIPVQIKRSVPERRSRHESPSSTARHRGAHHLDPATTALHREGNTPMSPVYNSLIRRERRDYPAVPSRWSALTRSERILIVARQAGRLRHHRDRRHRR